MGILGALTSPAGEDSIAGMTLNIGDRVAGTTHEQAWEGEIIKFGKIPKTEEPVGIARLDRSIDYKGRSINELFLPLDYPYTTPPSDDRPEPTIRTHATRTYPMQKLLLSDVRERVAQIRSDWDTKHDDAATHEAIDKLQLEVLHTIASAPAGAAFRPLKRMAALVANIEVEGLDFRKRSI